MPEAAMVGMLTALEMAANVERNFVSFLRHLGAEQPCMQKIVTFGTAF